MVAKKVVTDQESINLPQASAKIISTPEKGVNSPFKKSPTAILKGILMVNDEKPSNDENIITMTSKTTKIGKEVIN